MHEYAITDDQGQLFGLPAKTFTSKDAAEAVLTQLEQRRREMHREAEDASSQLGSVLLKLSAEDRERLREAVARWDAEKVRVYGIIRREVGEWEAVA